MATWVDKWVNRFLCWLLGHLNGRRYAIFGTWHGTVPFCPRCQRDL